ncbi:tail fiber domain-containing protein [Dyadobacter crusticola]|uniref:tail fiber domain-containing protein n=1 Tax=Dyadobacter crusticola TaxID=292407 RepID=UPI00146FB917|nr:tail fiber domain-containing protein [Dyadobacter crusticola]
MKSTFIIVLICCLPFFTQAQSARDFFTFQGVARTADGKVAANQNISLRFGIHPLFSPNIYQEEHTSLTNEQGVFTVMVGSGNVISGTFSNIDWESGYYFLHIEMDVNGGSNYISVGSTQLVSVPYAIHAKQTDRWKNNEPIVQTGFFDFGQPISDQPAGTRLIWYPKKAAFRAGYINSNAWNNNNIGQHTAAFGFDTKASGMYAFASGNATAALGASAFAGGDRSIASANSATALGSETKAQSAYATSLGRETVAKGIASTALGIQSTAHGVGSLSTGYLSSAEGNMSFTAGEGTYAKAFASATFGAYNNVQDNPLGPAISDRKSSDRIFQIGNGSGPTDLSNAFTMLRNGNIGLGKNALLPDFILDIDGRPRIRHNGETAGIYFSNTQNQPNAFVGMKNNDEVGFYIGNAWRFWVDNIGNAMVASGVLQSSDRRLKRNFTGLSNSLANINNLKGYHFYWKDKHLDQALQTGVIAQEIEKIFPELVKTDDSGFKSVNYTGLIPHLIEAIKELNTKNQELEQALSRLKSLEASVNQLLKNQQITTPVGKEAR